VGKKDFKILIGLLPTPFLKSFFALLEKTSKTFYKKNLNNSY
jgi:hypothetical protein